MSKNELLDAFMSGRISRRAFIRGLVGLGVSMSAAAAYAGVLKPLMSTGWRRGLASGSRDFYELYLYG